MTMSSRQTENRAARRRSRSVRLTTMAALAGTALTAGCGSSDEAATAPKVAGGKPVQVFENVFDCVKKTGKTESECQAAREASIAAAAKEAPRFAAVEDCEQDWGAGGCVEQEEEGRKHYSPFMRGFVFLSMSKGHSTPAYRPLFGRPGESGFRTASGARLGYGGAPGKYVASSRAFERPKTVPKVKAASAMASRGGFGERSGFKLAGGGSSRSSFGG